jgi:hypothetical protein
MCHRRNCIGMTSHSRGARRPSPASSPSRREGAGNAGCTLHPRSRVQSAQKKAHTSIQVQRRQSGIPCAMALRLMPRSPRRRVPFCHRRQRIRTCLSPVGPTHLRWLDISNGCQDHTVLPYATNAVRLRAANRSRIKRSALRFPSRADAVASTASRPAFVTIAIRPFCRVETTGLKPLICSTC